MTDGTRLVVFGAVALAFSVFYGANAAAIFQVPEVDKLSWRLHQFWLNFLGSLVGWAAAAFFFTRLLAAVASGKPVQFDWSSIGLALVAFVGVTGFLPVTVVTLINSIGALVGKIAGLPQKE